jgi:hypothetical protein
VKIFRAEKLFGWLDPITERAAAVLRPLLPRGRRPRPRKPARPHGQRPVAGMQALEARDLFYISVESSNFTTSNTTVLSVAEPGVLTGASDSGGYQLTAHLSSGAQDGTVDLNGDGSFTYTANPGFNGSDTFMFYATDTSGDQSYPASVNITVEYGVLTAVDVTKVAVDTIQLSQPVLSDPWPQAITSPLPAGGSGGTGISAEPADGAPATAHNLSLTYNSITASPDQVLEGDFQLSMNPVLSDNLTVSATFNGVQSGETSITTSNLTASNPNIQPNFRRSRRQFP